ncbi:PREDICTED: uncharacterized protein LOC104801405 [Tarenaya hassleriana]|uniref:uncharacterized protein LOC104801405 n=1 Tax=Tarenaya hassleriana TaxID=28532 RepID=UPI00053C85EA|nr:PREDICTED: uncharacterized protein LOC104801405 [Tarenaya hassleriana]XP_010522984.1 PREDICTED: uncharacterized protein LOC104801405 [Tarenaya hassleriana]
MNFAKMRGEAQHGSLFLGYNSEANQSLWPGKDTDMDMVKTGGFNLNGAFSFTCYGLYLKRFKESLKQTMLEHESVFEDQIHELHRLYWRQRELMVEMEGTSSHNLPRHPESLPPIAGFSRAFPRDFPRKCRTKTVPWMNSNISTFQRSILPCEEPSTRITAGLSGTDFEKSGKEVLDLELSGYEYLDIGEGRVSRDGEVQEAPNLWKEPSPRSISMESDFQLDKLHQFTDSSKFKCVLDLNEPAEIEEPLEIELNQFMNPVTGLCTANAIVGESNTRNDGDSESGSHGMNEEAQDQLFPIKCQAEKGIDLNMSPLSSDDKSTVSEKIEAQQPQESCSHSSHVNHGLGGRSRMVVQALPSSRGVASLQKGHKPLFRSSRTCKNVKCYPKNTGAATCPQSRTRNGSDLATNLAVNEDDDLLPSTASCIPGCKSASYQPSGRKRSVSSLGKVKGCGQGKKSRTTLKKAKSFLATEEDDDDEEIAAAKAIFNISSSNSVTVLETSAITNCDSLHWFAMIASSVFEDPKSEFGVCVRGCHYSSIGIQTEVEEHNTKHRKGRVRKGKRQYRGFKRKVLPNEVSEDLQTVGRGMETAGTKWNDGYWMNKIKSRISVKERRQLTDSPHEQMEEKRVFIDWGRVRRGRRGPRIPAANFQLVLSQV